MADCIASDASPHAAPTRGDWFLLGASAALLVALRLHAFDLPLETDECNYAYIGDQLLDGDRLYVDVWDHQPPGVFVLFAAASAVLGHSDAAYRWVAIAFSLASLFLIHGIARRHFGAFAGAVAAGAFAITSSDPGLAGEGCNREIYMNTFALGAIALLMRDTKTKPRTFAAGLLLGVASVFKTVVAAQWVLLVVWVAARQYSADRSIRSTAKAAIVFYVGPLGVWVAVCGYFAFTGRWEPFVDAVFLYNLGYSGAEQATLARLFEFFDPVFQVFNSAQPLWNVAIIAALGTVLLSWKRLTGAYGAVMAYLVGSFVAVCLPGRFWPHYYYLLLPPAVLVCASLLARLTEGEASSRRARVVRWGSVVWVAILLTCESVHYGLLAPADISAPHPVYRYRQAWSRVQGRRVGAVTDSDDTVFMWGEDAGIYYYSGRKCASRYTMIGALLDNASGAADRRRTLLRELSERRPRIVLIAEPEFPELRAFLQTHYLAASPKALDRHDANPEKTIMIALTDRDRPVGHIDWEWRPRK